MNREVDPEKDYRNWRYKWEKPWRKGLKINPPKVKTFTNPSLKYVHTIKKSTYST